MCLCVCLRLSFIALSFTSDEVTRRPVLAVLLIGCWLGNDSILQRERPSSTRLCISDYSPCRVAYFNTCTQALCVHLLQTPLSKAEVAAAQAFYRQMAKNESSAHL